MTASNQNKATVSLVTDSLITPSNRNKATVSLGNKHPKYPKAIRAEWSARKGGL